MKKNSSKRKDRRPQKQKAKGWGGSVHGDSWNEARHARRRRSEMELKENSWEDYYKEED